MITRNSASISQLSFHWDQIPRHPRPKGGQVQLATGSQKIHFLNGGFQSLNIVVEGDGRVKLLSPVEMAQ